MIDLSVKDLVKSFDTERNILDGLSFDLFFCLIRHHTMWYITR